MDVTFLQKSYGEHSKVEKSVLLTTSYEGLDDEEELEMMGISGKAVQQHWIRRDEHHDD